MKILSIDPGTKRVGAAACDELELSIRLLPVLTVSKSEKKGLLVEEIISLILKERFELVVIGLPLNMDGTEGKGAKESKKLADLLEKKIKKEKISCEVLLWDERLTSYEAEARLREKGVPKGKAREYLDSLAAEVLLEDYLRKHRTN